MEQRRFILFISLAALVLFGWMAIGPKLFPDWFPPPPQKQADKKEEDGEKAKQDDDALPVRAPRPWEVGKEAKKQPEPAKKDDEPKLAQADLPPVYAPRTVVLGSLDPESGYFQQVKLTSRGAAVETIELNDSRYRRIDDRNEPLTLVGATGQDVRTLALSVPEIDQALQKAWKNRTLRTVHWELVEKHSDPGGLKHEDGSPVYSAATFKYAVGGLEVFKTYRLQKIEDSGERAVRDATTKGYQLEFDLKIVNVGDQPRDVSYELQGPVGLPLEDPEYTRVYRNVRTGFARAGGGVKSGSKTAEDIAEAGDKQEQWEEPVGYIGIDVQYFAALLVPGGDQIDKPYIRSSQPVLIRETDPQGHSDISVVLESKVFALPPQAGDPLEHQYTLYAGPKREALLEPLGAADVVDYGWLSFLVRPMLGLMRFLHNSLWIPYGIAIIFLTIIVRGMLFPLSKKQAASAKKMKDLQPHIAEIRKKHAGDKEKMARAQMELFSKHGYNPLAGCLPLILQLPIFFALYRALNVSVDLRMAEFLWVDNLSAPDQLFRLPFDVPILGWHHFNLLPILTVALFVFQQKMMMPPPADEQQAMQHKMMKYMSIFFGFLFYNFPAGLCVYFITSSLWGMAERKLLDIRTESTPVPAGGEPGGGQPPGKGRGPGGGRPPGGGPGGGKPDGEKPRGLWARLLEKADEAAAARTRSNGDGKPRGGRGGGGGGDRKRGGGKKKKKRRSRR